MPVSRRILLGSAGIMGLSTVAAACDQNGRSVANAAGSQEIVSADSATAGPAPNQQKGLETTSQNQIEIDELDEGAADSAPDTVFSLRTGISGSRLVFIGDGGAIDGEINPDLVVKSGDVVEVTLVNGNGAEHDFVIASLTPEQIASLVWTQARRFHFEPIGTANSLSTVPSQVTAPQAWKDGSSSVSWRSRQWRKPPT